MKNVLFVTESYEIAPSPNGNIVKILASQMQKEGFCVSVLALKNQFIKKDADSEGIKVFRVGTYLEWKLTYLKIPKFIKSVLIRIVKGLKLLFTPMHPLTSPLVLKNLYRRGKKIVKNYKIDVVVGVYRDAETAETAYKLKKKFPNLKLAIYTLDAISGGVCSNKFVSSKMHNKRCKKLEEKFVRACDLYLPLVSHKNVYEGRFKGFEDKIKYVDLPNLLLNDYDYGKESNEIINFTFTGMMTETNADCSYFLSVFEKLLEITPCVFNLYGGISDSILKKIKEKGLESKVIFYGNRTQEELVNIRKQADVLCTFGNYHPCGVPCKIFEYIGTKKPILAFYKIDDDAGKVYLESYSKSIILKEQEGCEEEHTRFILNKLAEIKNVIVTNQEIEKIYYKNTPKEFIDLIKEI